RVEVEREARVIRFAFPQPPRTGRRVAALKGVHKAYGDNVVYAGVDFEVERGARIALVGPNGAGKSTLLRMLAGGLPFDGGGRSPRFRARSCSSRTTATSSIASRPGSWTLCAEVSSPTRAPTTIISMRKRAPRPRPLRTGCRGARGVALSGT